MPAASELSPPDALAHRLVQAAAVLAILTLGYVAYLHCRIITHPAPMEYREGAATVTTDLLLHGGNPYQLENLPLHTQVYGIGYHLIVLPFAKVFGPGFTTHRAVSAAFILGICWLVFRAVRQAGGNRWQAAVGATLMYATLAARIWPLQPFSMPSSTLAKPDAAGMFFYLLAILVPLHRRFHTAGLVLSAAFTIVAFFLKPYFVVGFPIVAAYLFVFRSKRLGLVAVGSFIAAMIAALMLVSLIAPAFVPIVLVGNAHSTTESNQHLVNQLIALTWQSPGLVAIVIVSAVAGLRRPVGFDLQSGREPLLRMSGNYLAFVCACSVLGLTLKLGRHTGSSLLYFHHLLTPWLILLACAAARRPGRWGVLFSLLLLIDTAVTVRGLPSPPRPHAAVWQAWRDRLADARHVYAGPPLAELLRQQGKPVYDTGLSEYFRFSFDDLIMPWAAEYENRQREYLLELKRLVREEKFDLIVLPYFHDTVSNSDAGMWAFTSKPLIRAHYREVGRMPLPMDWSPHYLGVILVPKGNPNPVDSP